MFRVKALISGRVQGVGFRYFVQISALKYNLTGWVKNLSDGDVSLEAQGNKIDIEKFLGILKDGNRFAKVKNISIHEIDLDPLEKKFKVTY